MTTRFPTEFFSLTGTVLAAAFSPSPTLTLVPGADASIDFQVPYELLGITFTSSLLNYGTARLGAFVIIGQNLPTLAYSKTTSAPVGSVTLQNSLVGPPAVPIPTNKTIAVVFLQPKLITPGTKIALYTFGDNTAGNQADLFVALTMRQVESN